MYVCHMIYLSAWRNVLFKQENKFSSIFLSPFLMHRFSSFSIVTIINIQCAVPWRLKAHSALKVHLTKEKYRSIIWKYTLLKNFIWCLEPKFAFCSSVEALLCTFQLSDCSPGKRVLVLSCVCLFGVDPPPAQTFSNPIKALQEGTETLPCNVSEHVLQS